MARPRNPFLGVSVWGLISRSLSSYLHESTMAEDSASDNAHFLIVPMQRPHASIGRPSPVRRLSPTTAADSGASGDGRCSLSALRGQHTTKRGTRSVERLELKALLVALSFLNADFPTEYRDLNSSNIACLIEIALPSIDEERQDQGSRYGTYDPDGAPISHAEIALLEPSRTHMKYESS